MEQYSFFLFIIFYYIIIFIIPYTDGHYGSTRTFVLIPKNEDYSNQITVSRKIRSFNVTSPTITQKKTNYIQFENEKRALKKKRKRLRQLRDEVRQLSSQINSKKFLKDEITMDKMEKNKLKESRYGWRKQISYRIKTIMKRLKKIENDLKYERKKIKIKEKKRLNKNEKINNGITVITTTMPYITTSTTTPNLKMKRLHLSINQSKNGESGGTCNSHKDCKPGLCCDRIIYTNGSYQSHCNQYSHKEGDYCDDSCQCEARLNCFKTLHYRQIISDNNDNYTLNIQNTRPICKKVSTEDVINGISLNSKDSWFDKSA